MVHCQRDSFIREFESEVIDCKQWSVPSEIDNKRKGKKNKKKKKKQQIFYEIELKDTILFPEGGGQPTDNGSLTIINDDQKINKNDNDKNNKIDILSVYRSDKGRVLHKSTKEVNIGSKVNINLNWQRRFDHMQQHSAQHLISAVFRNTLDTPTISWWMSQYPKSSLIEMKIQENSNKKISDQDIIKCEKLINDVISAGKTMTVHVFNDESSVDEFAKLNPKFKTKALPSGAGPLRVIEIPDVEFNVCCGTHLSNTSQLQMIKITSYDKDDDNGLLKINFVAGNRIIDNYNTMYQTEKGIGKLLSCGNDEFINNIDKLQKDLKTKTSQLRAVEKRLIELEINGLFNDNFMNISNDLKIKCIYQHFSNGNMKMVQGICDGVLNLVKEEMKENEINVFIMMTMGISTKSGQYLMATNDLKLLSPKNKQTKTKILSFIDGSGGGKPGRLQGKANNFKGYPQLFEFVNTLYPSDQSNNNDNDKTLQQIIPKLSKDKPKDAISGLDQLIDNLQ